MEPITDMVCPLFHAAKIIAKDATRWYSNRCKEEKCMWYKKCMSETHPIYIIKDQKVNWPTSDDLEEIAEAERKLSQSKLNE